MFFALFFFNDTATTEIYTLSLHDALPISNVGLGSGPGAEAGRGATARGHSAVRRSVLSRARRRGDVRRTSAQGSDTAAPAGGRPAPSRTRPRAPGARPLPGEPRARGEAPLAGVPRCSGPRPRRAPRGAGR